LWFITDNGGGGRETSEAPDGDATMNGADGDASEGTKSELDKKQDLSQNRCTMVWEGALKTQGFRKFMTKPCPTDALAKEALGRAKMENFWTVAKNLVKAT